MNHNNTMTRFCGIMSLVLSILLVEGGWSTLYAQGANTWEQKADFGGSARSGAVGFSIGSKGYIGTGYDANGNTKDFWEYDPTANTWTQKADFGGSARYSAIGFSIGSKGYVGTGYDANGNTKDFWEYDPTANSWTQKADCGGSARQGAVGFSMGSKGYIGTGLDDSSAPTKDFWEYNPTANSWTQKADFGGSARYYAVGFSMDSKGYISMGQGADGYTKDFWEYNPTANSWTQKADFGGSARDTPVGFSIGSKGYIGTGSNGYNSNLKDFWAYTPALSTALTTTGTLNPFTACAGTASAEQSFTVSGSGLTAGITITAPAGFEVSTSSGSDFGNSVSLTQSGGSVASTTVYVRMTATATGTPSGNVTVASTGATTQNVAVSDTVTALPTINLGTINSVSTSATSFSLPYSNPTGNPDQYSITAGTPTPMPSFTAVSTATFPTSPISVTIPASAANTYNFNLSVRNSITGCVSATVPFTLTVNTGTLTLGTATNPTTCGGTNGSIPFTSTGITAGSQTLSYKKDAAATATTVSVNVAANGSFTLTGLGKGVYSDFAIGSTTATGSRTLNDPSYSLAISTPTNPTTCGGTDGKIAFTYGSGTIPDGTYSMSYSLGGSTLSKDVQFGSAGSRISAEASSPRTAFLTGLGAGSYSDILITVNGCIVTPTGTQPVQLSAPAAPTFTVGTAVKPTTCVATDGSLPLNGLANSTSYSVSYQKDGATAVVQNISSNASGVLTIPNLGAGAYTNITVTRNSCTSSPATATVAAPSFSITAGSPTQPTTCSGNGSIPFTTSLPGGTYTIAYKKDGVGASTTIILGGSTRVAAGASTGNSFTLSNLTAGTYTDFKIVHGGCDVTAAGPVTFSDPTAPTFTVGTAVKPSTCVATDGSLPLNGLTASTSYSVSYQKDGAVAVVQTLSSNGSGVLTLLNLGVGAYTNITVTRNSCTSATANATIAAPTFTMTAGSPTQPTTCGGNGSIPFTTSLSGGTYTIAYKKDGVGASTTIILGGSGRVAAGASTGNSFTLSNLTAGTYTDFKIVYGGCDVVAAGPVTLNDPTGPNAFSVTGGSSFCTGGTGSVVGLSGSQTGVNYQLKRGSDNVGGLVAGSGSAISFGNQATTGVYTVVATHPTTLCSTTMTGNATINNFPQPQASISGNATVCKDNTPSLVSFTATVGTAPYIFSYKINNGATQTISSNTATATLLHPTNVSGVFEYSLVSLQDGNGCNQVQSGSITINVLTKPSITLAVNGLTLGEGNTQTVCDLDANPVNSLQFTVGTACLVGNPVWRVQIGGGVWSDWSANSPTTQLSNNQTYRYQAACDANCTNTYTELIAVAINYRASVPQNVSLTADGTSVAAGESKEICDQSGNTITFNATCAAGERLLYSVDGGSYLPTVPSQMVDGQFHNYRVRCQKADGTPSCVETESGVMRLKISTIAAAPVASLSVTSGCGTPANFSGTATCPAGFTTVWYNATTNAVLPNLPTITPNESTSYYARCQNTASAGELGCQSANSNTVSFTLTPVNEAPVVSVSSELVCTGQEVTVSTTCPAGASVLWNTGVTESSFKVAFSNITTQSYSAKCVFSNGCQSTVSAAKSVRWKGFELTIINIGQSKSAIKTNDRSAWASQFVTADGGPSLDNSTESNPTLFYSENANKTGPRYWTIHADACALGTSGSMTFDMLATPETGVVRSYNTHENNAPYFMYANREGYTELYAQNHPIYGFYQDNGSGVNVYDEGLPKGLYKLGVRYWDMKGWGSIFPSTRKPQGSVLAYQEYWFRIQSKDGIGTGAARVASDNNLSPWKGLNPLTFAEIVPNPVSSVLRLKVTDAKAQKVNVSLIDASGRTLLQRNFVPETNQHQEEFNVSEMANGMYFLKVNAGDKQATLKVVKVQ